MADRLDRVLALAQARIPGLRLVDRRDVLWWRAITPFIRLFNPHFDRFTVVIGSTVYLPCPPAKLPADRLAATLCHELVHQLDQAQHGLWFYVSYGVVLPTWRTWRAHWERRAYTVDLLLAHERGGPEEVRRVAAWLVDVFAGPSYLVMWGGRSAARRLLEPVVDGVLDGSLARTAPYDAILAAWRGGGSR